MGRELKRVPLDFDWPLNMPWRGYMSPYTSQKCQPCDGSGHNPETKRISDDFYDSAGTGRRWNDKITQDEVDALVEAGRLLTFNPDTRKREAPVELTAAIVNAANRRGASVLGDYKHDGINRWILIKARAKRLGVFGTCRYCNGEGHIYFSDAIKEKGDKWHDEERYDPPSGDGWQVWETVSEGSPIGPVFATGEELVTWCVGQGYSDNAARSFVFGSGWVPSMTIVDGVMRSGIECADVLGAKESS